MDYLNIEKNISLFNFRGRNHLKSSRNNNNVISSRGVFNFIESHGKREDVTLA